MFTLHVCKSLILCSVSLIDWGAMFVVYFQFWLIENKTPRHKSNCLLLMAYDFANTTNSILFFLMNDATFCLFQFTNETRPLTRDQISLWNSNVRALAHQCVFFVLLLLLFASLLVWTEEIIMTTTTTEMPNTTEHYKQLSLIVHWLFDVRHAVCKECKRQTEQKKKQEEETHIHILKWAHRFWFFLYWVEIMICLFFPSSSLIELRTYIHVVSFSFLFYFLSISIAHTFSHSIHISAAKCFRLFFF